MCQLSCLGQKEKCLPVRLLWLSAPEVEGTPSSLCSGEAGSILYPPCVCAFDNVVPPAQDKHFTCELQPVCYLSNICVGWREAVYETLPLGPAFLGKLEL